VTGVVTQPFDAERVVKVFTSDYTFDPSDENPSQDTSFLSSSIATPSRSPTTTPSRSQTTTPSRSQTTTPSRSPTATPSRSPTATPTQSPTATPSRSPTATSTQSPTEASTQSPTEASTQSTTETPTISSDDLSKSEQGGFPSYAIVVVVVVAILIGVFSFFIYRRFKNNDAGDKYEDFADQDPEVNPLF
jgi:cobalamin biosynthesis Mg chelatase CobN